MTVTDEDRARAAAMYDSWFGGDEMDDEIIGDIAAALAAEREKARVPFLALIEQAGDGLLPGLRFSDDCCGASLVPLDVIRKAAQAEP